MMMKAILIPMAEHTKQSIINISVIVLHILSDVSSDLATQLGSRKLVAKFILGGFIQ